MSIIIYKASCWPIGSLRYGIGRRWADTGRDEMRDLSDRQGEELTRERWGWGTYRRGRDEAGEEKGWGRNDHCNQDASWKKPMNLKISWSGIYYGVTDLRSKVQLKINAMGWEQNVKSAMEREAAAWFLKLQREGELWGTAWGNMAHRWTEGRAQGKWRSKTLRKFED